MYYFCFSHLSYLHIFMLFPLICYITSNCVMGSIYILIWYMYIYLYDELLGEKFSITMYDLYCPDDLLEVDPIHILIMKTSFPKLNIYNIYAYIHTHRHTCIFAHILLMLSFDFSKVKDLTQQVNLATFHFMYPSKNLVTM